LGALQQVFEKLCRDYLTAPPAGLRQKLRRLFAQLMTIRRGRLTLAQHREVVALTGWATALLACVNWGDNEREAAEACRLATLRSADEAGHGELRTWSLELQAWFALTEGRYRDVLAIATEQATAGDNSASIQLTMQSGRAAARMSAVRGTGRSVRAHSPARALLSGSTADGLLDEKSFSAVPVIALADAGGPCAAGSARRRYGTRPGRGYVSAAGRRMSAGYSSGPTPGLLDRLFRAGARGFGSRDTDSRRGVDRLPLRAAAHLRVTAKWQRLAAIPGDDVVEPPVAAQAVPDHVVVMGEQSRFVHHDQEALAVIGEAVRALAGHARLVLHRCSPPVAGRG
jgi:hypothetical protein